MLPQTLIKKMAEKEANRALHIKIQKEKIANEYQKWILSINTQFTHLKDAPLEEYFSRILDIATQMKEHGIKF